MVMDAQKVETRALSDDQLDGVAGGFLCSGLPLSAVSKLGAGQGDGSQGGQGGQNDPAQMFQRILEQLTQGQG
jgi:hypothetical protein